MPVRTGDKWGFVDLAGNEAIAPRFDEVSYFDRGMSWTPASAPNGAPSIAAAKRISALSCQKTKPINVKTPGTHSCRLQPLVMPKVPEDPPDPPLIRPPVPR